MRIRSPRPVLLVPLAVALVLLLPALAQAATVFIDPGHGGPYRAGRVYGVTEKELNLAIALELRAVLEKRGHRVGMSRTTDRAVCLSDIPTWNWSESAGWRYYADGAANSGTVPKDDLQARCNIANDMGADVFVSIHNNAGGGRGTETYSARQDVLGHRLASLVQDGIIDAVGTYDRGAPQTDFYVVRWSNMPAVLVEAAFYDNRYDSALLKQAWFRRKVAEGIASGIDSFFAGKPFTQVYTRHSGRDRYATAAAVSKQGWPDGARTVLLASGKTWPDALAAGPLSRKLDAPLLLGGRSGLSPYTAAELKRLRPTKLIVLGGEGAVDATMAAQASVASSLTTAAIERIAGSDRYETAALIARRMGLKKGCSVFVASGKSFPDGLSASAAAGTLKWPLLLTRPRSVPTATASFVTSYSVPSAVVVGGTGVVSKDAASSLPRPSRVAGRDRYATAVAVAERFWVKGAVSPVFVAGYDFPDALVAGTYAAKNARPMLLIGKRTMSPRTREWLQRTQDAGRLPSSRTAGVTMIGGTATLPYLMDWEIRKARD